MKPWGKLDSMSCFLTNNTTKTSQTLSEELTVITDPLNSCKSRLCLPLGENKNNNRLSELTWQQISLPQRVIITSAAAKLIWRYSVMLAGTNKQTNKKDNSCYVCECLQTGVFVCVSVSVTFRHDNRRSSEEKALSRQGNANISKPLNLMHNFALHWHGHFNSGTEKPSSISMFSLYYNNDN